MEGNIKDADFEIAPFWIQTVVLSPMASVTLGKSLTSLSFHFSTQRSAAVHQGLSLSLLPGTVLIEMQLPIAFDWVGCVSE